MRHDAVAGEHVDADQNRQDQGIHLCPDHTHDSRDEHPEAEPSEGFERVAIHQAWRDTQVGAEDAGDNRIAGRGEDRSGDHRRTEGNHSLAGEQHDQRCYRVEDLAGKVDDLDPAVALQTLEDADECERRQTEEGLGGEQDE